MKKRGSAKRVGFAPDVGGVRGMALGGNPTTTPTNPILLRGQDKKMTPMLGQNPNTNIEDEYVHNLQQQMHFMDLELKILKEKVVEDEKNSGIGSLFNDNKNKHEHINELKYKYQEMKRAYDRRLDGMEKQKLSVLGDQFVLDAQINIMSDLNKRMMEIFENHEGKTLGNIRDLERQYQELYNDRTRLDQDMEGIGRDLKVSNEDNYTHNMQLTKEEEADKTELVRYEREKASDEALIAQKEEQITALEATLAEIQAKFEANQEYQQNVETREKMSLDIEDKYVELELLNAKVQELDEARELYDRIKEEELEEKKRLEDRYEELCKDLEAKEQMNRMRAQKRMNDTRNPEIKELILNQEVATENIEDLKQKVQDEIDKYNKLRDEKLELERQLKLCGEDTEDHKTRTEEQKAELDEIKAAIGVLEGEVKELQTTQVTDQETNDKVQALYRKLAQANVALKAKLEFLKKNFDYTQNVKQLSVDDFKLLVDTNQQVNDSIGKFLERLTQTKTDYAGDY